MKVTIGTSETYFEICRIGVVCWLDMFWMWCISRKYIDNIFFMWIIGPRITLSSGQWWETLSRREITKMMRHNLCLSRRDSYVWHFVTLKTNVFVDSLSSFMMDCFVLLDLWWLITYMILILGGDCLKYVIQVRNCLNAYLIVYRLIFFWKWIDVLRLQMFSRFVM